MLPLSTNIREAYKNGQDDEQNFIQNLALFLCTFLKEHAAIIEQKVGRGAPGYGGVYTCDFLFFNSQNYRITYWR